MIKKRTMLLLLLYMIIGIFVLLGVTASYYAYSIIYKEIIVAITFVIVDYLPIFTGIAVLDFVSNYLSKKARQNQKNMNSVIRFVLEVGSLIVGIFIGFFLVLIIMGILGSMIDPNISGINLVDGFNYIISIMRDVIDILNNKTSQSF